MTDTPTLTAWLREIADRFDRYAMQPDRFGARKYRAEATRYRQAAEAVERDAGLRAALEDFAIMPCETKGAEDMEPGCCRTCRARAALAQQEKQDA